jgi:hypothetical protein
MTNAPTPWVGLAALIAMFVIPFLPDWLFEGPRTIKHWPRRHVCGKCGEPWTGDHRCVHDSGLAVRPPLRGELRRPETIAQSASLGRRGARTIAVRKLNKDR